MKTGPRYTVRPRRHRQGVTDYRHRLNLLKARKVRIVVRKSLKKITVQFVDYNAKGDTVIAQAISSDLLKSYGWGHSISSTPAAYLTGILAATKAKEAGVSEGVLDIGRYPPTKGNKVFAALQGVVEAGIDCPHSEDKLPDEDRLMGKHIDSGIEADVLKIKKELIGGGN